jgi:hypothetical protein
LDCRAGIDEDEHEANATVTKLYTKLMQIDICFKDDKPDQESVA